MTENLEKAQQVVRDLSNEEYQEFESWMLLVERKERPRREAEREKTEAVAEGQAALLEQLRATGQLAEDAVIPAIPLVPVVADEGEVDSDDRA